MNSEQTVSKLSQAFPELENTIRSIIRFKPCDGTNPSELLMVNEILVDLQDRLNTGFSNARMVKEFTFNFNNACSLITCLFHEHDLIDDLIEEHNDITKSISNISDFLVFSQQRLNKCFEIFGNSLSKDTEHYIKPLSDILFSYLYFQKNLNS
tara:strand:- start:3952 stop:4410 length:459 start_codon:yes stop_codon:yes gene_type:complete